MSEISGVNNESSNYIVPPLDEMDLVDAAEPQQELSLRYGIKLGGYGLLVPDEIESEVIIDPKVFSVPNTSENMLGLISMRGRFAPVFDIAKMLDIPLQNHQKMIIVLTIDGNSIAFQYDSAHSLELPEYISKNQATLPEAMIPFVGDCYQITDQYWYEFDIKTFVEQSASKISI